MALLTLVSSLSLAAPRCYDAESVQVTSGIEFGSAMNHETGQVQTLLLDRYAPPATADAGPRPAFVLIHGGAFISGSRTSDNEPKLAMELARRGFVAVSIDYRLEGRAFGTEKYCCPGNESEQYAIDAAFDAKAAVRFLNKHAAEADWNVDTQRIGVAGDSAGAVTSLYVGYSPVGEGSSGNPGFNSSVRVVVPISGELNYEAWCKGFDASGAAYGCVSGSWHRSDDVRSPSQPPLAMVHGTKDLIVPIRQAQLLESRAKEVGLPVKLISIPGAGHVPILQLLESYMDELITFVDAAMDIQGSRAPCEPMQ